MIWILLIAEIRCVRCKWPLYRNKCLFLSWQCWKSLLLLDAFKYIYQGASKPNYWPNSPSSVTSLQLLMPQLWCQALLMNVHYVFNKCLWGTGIALWWVWSWCERQSKVRCLCITTCWKMCSAAEGPPVLNPSDPVQLKHLNSLEELLLMNWIRLRLSKCMTKRIVIMHFLWISLLWNAMVYFSQRFQWGEQTQTCPASGRLQHGPDYIRGVCLGSLDVFGGDLNCSGFSWGYGV